MPPPSILLVEDNPEDIDLARLALSRAGSAHPLVVATDGAEALDLLADETMDVPALILLDLNLPRVDGREVLRQMRARERTKFVPVVVLTSSSAERDILECYEAGANAYVVKPLEFREFEDALESILDAWLGVCPTAPRSVPGGVSYLDDVLVALADEGERTLAASILTQQTRGLVHTTATVAAANRVMSAGRERIRHILVDDHLPDGETSDVVANLRNGCDHRVTVVVLAHRLDQQPAALRPADCVNAVLTRPADPEALGRALQVIARFWLGRNRVPGSPYLSCIR